MNKVTKLRVVRPFRNRKTFFYRGPFNGRPGYEMAPVYDDSGWYHVFQNEKAAYNSRYLFTGDFRPAFTHPYQDESEWVYLALALANRYQYTFITERGRPATAESYFDARPFHRGFAVVEAETGGWHHINWQLKPIYTERFDDITALERFVDENRTPYLRCEAFRRDRLYSIFIRGDTVDVIPCIAC